MTNPPHIHSNGRRGVNIANPLGPRQNPTIGTLITRISGAQSIKQTNKQNKQVNFGHTRQGLI